MVLEMQDAQAEERRRSEREEERHVAHCSQYSSTGLRAKYQCQKDWDVYSVRLHWNPISEGLSYFGNLPCFWYDDCGFCPIDELPGYCEGAWKVISP